MTPTTTAFLISELIKKIESESTKMGIMFLRIMLSAFWTAFQPYIPYTIFAFFLITLIVMVKAILGETGLLGSVIYHVAFFGILAVVVLICGLEILFNPYFDLISYLVYIVSFRLTGLILKKFR